MASKYSRNPITLYGEKGEDLRAEFREMCEERGVTSTGMMERLLEEYPEDEEQG